MKATIQYISALEELMTATKSGKINWIRNRPESFKYKIMNEDLEDLLISITKLDDDYILTLEKKDFESTQIILNLDTTTTDLDLRDNLSELFETIEYHVDLNNLEGLNQFVKLVTNPDTRKSILD
ncbi:MAG: hypothetical protein ACPGGA_09590 [Balneolaceae bacterium]